MQQRRPSAFRLLRMRALVLCCCSGAGAAGVTANAPHHDHGPSRIGSGKSRCWRVAAAANPGAGELRLPRELWLQPPCRPSSVLSGCGNIRSAAYLIKPAASCVDKRAGHAP